MIMISRRGRTTQSRMEESSNRFWDWSDAGTARERGGGVVIVVAYFFVYQVGGERKMKIMDQRMDGWTIEK